MNRLIATIKYGSLKIRLFLLAVFILVVGGLVLAVYGGITYTLWALAAGAAGIIAGLLMVFLAHFAVEDIDSDEGDEPEQDAEYREKSSPVGKVGTSAQGRRAQKGNAQPNGESAEEKLIEADDYTPEIELDEPDYGSLKGDYNDEEEEPARREFWFFRLFGRRKKRDAAAGRVERESDGDGGESKERRKAGSSKRDSKSDEGGRTDEKGRKVRLEVHTVAAEYAEKYTSVVYKQLLRKYKVKRDYIPIVIDESKKFDTARTPALCWVKKKMAHFLLMEGNERVVSMPYTQFLRVTYRPNVREEKISDYNKLRKEMGIYATFEDVFPSFQTGTERSGTTYYTKNQYVLGGIVAVTPRSMRALREKYSFDMSLFDSLGQDKDYSVYFKRAYEARILWIDQVIGQQEYQNMIGGILQRMVDDVTLIRYDFLDDLEKMVQNRLITTEYADYYLQLRQKRDSGNKKR